MVKLCKIAEALCIERIAESGRAGGVGLDQESPSPEGGRRRIIITKSLVGRLVEEGAAEGW